MEEGVLASVERLLERAGVPFAMIGGHAVNAWVEPRATGDVDITVQAGLIGIETLKRVLSSEGYSVVCEHGANLPSGPDFVRFLSADGLISLEVQSAKTDFQRSVIQRAMAGGKPRVATPEDLIVLKLIANRPKDQIDLIQLCKLPDLDWAYVERWAGEWDVTDRLRKFRQLD